MTAREMRLWEKKNERYLISEYGSICLAAGYEISQLSGSDCYGLATAIMGRIKTAYVVKGAFGSRDYLGTLRSMTAAEKAELRTKTR